MDTDLAKAREATGIMEGTQEDLTAESEQQTEKPKTSSDSETSDDESETEEENEESDDEEDEEDEGSKKKKSPSYKPTPAERQLFRASKRTSRQIAQIAEVLDRLVTTSVKPTATADQTPQQDEASEKIKSFATALAQKQGLDEEGTTEMIAGIVSLIKDLTPKEQATLPAEVQEDLKLVKKFLGEEKERSDQAATASHFEEEWTSFLPELRKQYPHAGASELAQAEEKMFEIAHSENGGVIIDEAKKTIRGYPLDFLLHKNRKDFDAILKVAANKRGAEGGSKEIVDSFADDSDEDIDMDLETMTPEKFQRRQEQKIRQNSAERSNVKIVR